MRWLRFSLVPALACLAVAFAFLPRTGADATLKIRSLAGKVAFSPSPLRVEVGSRIAVVNETEVTHQLRADCAAADATPTLPAVQPGQTVFVQAPAEGSYALQDCAAPETSLTLIIGNPAQASPSPSPSPTA